VSILASLDSFFRHAAPASPGDTLLVAFSGGPDSTALLLGLIELASRRGLHLLAAHLDHGADPGSRARAAAAAGAAARLGVECVVERREVPRIARAEGWGEGPEAAARRVRYRFLEEIRRERGARWIVTAHHRDDQAETVALRLLHGSGVEGLAGIRARRGRVVRPLLELPREALRRAVEAAGIEALDDPTNRDRSLARNRLRHELLPGLEAAERGTAERLARLAGAAGGARASLERRLSEALCPEPVAGGGVAVLRDAFEALPEALAPHALALLHRRAGAAFPAGRAARAELLRQLAAASGGRSGRAAGCDLPGGWRWEVSGRLLALLRHRPPAPRFAYTLPVPGTLELPELGLAVRVRREPPAPWMFTGSRHRAGLALPLAPGDRVVVRNRRPGDRLRPLGAPGSRKLKDVLIDRRVPRHERDRLPLLCVGERIAWVPGVTVDEAFRLPAELRHGGATCWTAEVIP
jgi:tRNA(Ile)-lysidine synthase